MVIINFSDVQAWYEAHQEQPYIELNGELFLVSPRLNGAGNFVSMYRFESTDRSKPRTVDHKRGFNVSYPVSEYPEQICPTLKPEIKALAQLLVDSK